MLRYKYVMNEPFSNGVSDQFANSHDQVAHKRKCYRQDTEGDKAMMKTQEEEKAELQQDMVEEFKRKAAPDIDSFLVKLDQ